MRTLLSGVLVLSLPPSKKFDTKRSSPCSIFSAASTSLRHFAVMASLDAVFVSFSRLVPHGRNWLGVFGSFSSR